ncbi:MAG: arginine repressor [Candidatus Borkfalkiaceae bacterium]|nr:arginine repressor [Christensenellaceae bacterium]
MSKIKRQQKILDSIKQYEIETQEELIAILRNAGFNVTQATVSRDINELQLIKIAGSGKKYRYAQVTQGKSIDNAKFLTLFKAAVVSIEAAQNIVVVKTLISNANPVAATVDSLGYHEIVGSVAGDDTLLIVTHNNEEAANVVAKLNALL